MGELYRGCASASLVYRGFPEYFLYANLFGIAPFGFLAIFVISRGWSPNVTSRFEHLVSAEVHPAIWFSLAAAILLFAVTNSFRHAWHSFRLFYAAVGYLTIALLVTYAFVGWVINPALAAEIGTPEKSGWVPGLRWLDPDGRPVPALLTAHLVMVLWTIAMGTTSLVRLAHWRITIFLAIGTVLVSVPSWAKSDVRGQDLLLSLTCASIFATLALTLSFHTRFGRFARYMQDAITGLIITIGMVFFYTESPRILLVRSTAFLAFFALVLLVDNWFDPGHIRRRRRT